MDIGRIEKVWEVVEPPAEEPLVLPETELEDVPVMHAAELPVEVGGEVSNG